MAPFLALLSLFLLPFQPHFLPATTVGYTTFMYPAVLAEPFSYFFRFFVFLGSNYHCQTAYLLSPPLTFDTEFTPSIICCHVLFITSYYCYFFLFLLQVLEHLLLITTSVPLAVLAAGSISSLFRLNSCDLERRENRKSSRANGCSVGLFFLCAAAAATTSKVASAVS